MLFNKDLNGSRELYELSGTFQASADFRSIESELDSARNEVASVIGEEVMALAEQAYEADIPTEAQQLLANAVRKPVAYLAISRHARLNMLSHGETGRKIKTDDNEKVPFEWMVDRDDREMRERYYRAMDLLLEYLEKQGLAEWSRSGCGFRQRSSIVRSLAAMEEVYPADHSYYMYYKMLPVMLEVQNTRLAGLVGTDTVNAILAGSAGETVAATAVRYVVLHALVTAVKRWTLDAFPLSVSRRFSPTYQGNRASSAASLKEIEWYLGNLLEQATEAEKDLVTAISGNPWKGARLVPDNDPRKKYCTV